jgi:hypothetical protein
MLTGGNCFFFSASPAQNVSYVFVVWTGAARPPRGDKDGSDLAIENARSAI